MKKIIIISIILLVILIGIGYVMLGKTNLTNTGNSQDLASSENSVNINNFQFSPSTLTIKAGEKVAWTNKESALHTIKSDSGSEMSSEQLLQGESYEHIFANLGTYAYHCSIHPGMKGTIIVQ